MLNTLSTHLIKATKSLHEIKSSRSYTVLFLFVEGYIKTTSSKYFQTKQLFQKENQTRILQE